MTTWFVNVCLLSGVSGPVFPHFNKYFIPIYYYVVSWSVWEILRNWLVSHSPYSISLQSTNGIISWKFQSNLIANYFLVYNIHLSQILPMHLAQFWKINRIFLPIGMYVNYWVTIRLSYCVGRRVIFFVKRGVITWDLIPTWHHCVKCTLDFKGFYQFQIDNYALWVNMRMFKYRRCRKTSLAIAKHFLLFRGHNYRYFFIDFHEIYVFIEFLGTI